MKKAAQDNLKRGSIPPKSQSDTSGDTASVLAAQHGVSCATVIRDGKRAEAIEKLAAIEPEQARAVRDGLKRFSEVQREKKKAASPR